MGLQGAGQATADILMLYHTILDLRTRLVVTVDTILWDTVLYNTIALYCAILSNAILYLLSIY